ncbi:hypothetical protein SK128_025701 [Halocaridina rubra]|uniref:Uncharacterized protein n=1 Tax=Halocaridina rubra TaxID=373956 RepID=A0AAN8WX32_HALRR
MIKKILKGISLFKQYSRTWRIKQFWNQSSNSACIIHAVKLELEVNRQIVLVHILERLQVFRMMTNKDVSLRPIMFPASSRVSLSIHTFNIGILLAFLWPKVHALDKS